MCFIYAYYLFFSCKLPWCSSSLSGFVEALSQWEPGSESGLLRVTAVPVNRNILNTVSNRPMPWLGLFNMHLS